MYANSKSGGAQTWAVAHVRPPLLVQAEWAPVVAHPEPHETTKQKTAVEIRPLNSTTTKKQRYGGSVCLYLALGVQELDGFDQLARGAFARRECLDNVLNDRFAASLRRTERNGGHVLAKTCAQIQSDTQQGDVTEHQCRN